MWLQGEQPFNLPDNEIMQTIMGDTGKAAPTMRLHKIRKPLKRLWEIGVLSISQLLNKKRNQDAHSPRIGQKPQPRECLPPGSI